MDEVNSSVVLLTGSNGMLGSSILRQFRNKDFLVLSPPSNELDLRDSIATLSYIKSNKVDTIIHCAAKVGGISANIKQPADFILTNLQIDTSLLSAARKQKVRRLIYFGSSCMYPRNSNQPMTENSILSGLLEPTNQGYAIAKISATEVIKSVQIQDSLNWRVLVLSNLYGPRDNFDPQSSHLIAAIIAKIHDAKKNSLKKVEIWGSGNSRREFTFVDDVAEFITSHIGNLEEWSPVMNLGSGIDYSINYFYELVSELMEYKGEFFHDLTKPDGMPRKLMDSSLAERHGWQPKTNLKLGLEKSIAWFESEVAR